MTDIKKEQPFGKKEFYRLDDMLIYQDDEIEASYKWVKWIFVGEKANQVLYRFEGGICIHLTGQGHVATFCPPKSCRKDDIKISEVKSYYDLSKQWVIEDVEWFIKLLDYSYPLGVFNFNNCEEAFPEISADILSDLGYQSDQD